MVARGKEADAVKNIEPFISAIRDALRRPADAPAQLTEHVRQRAILRSKTGEIDPEAEDFFDAWQDNIQEVIEKSGDPELIPFMPIGLRAIKAQEQKRAEEAGASGPAAQSEGRENTKD